MKDVKNGIENTISGPAIDFNVNQTVAARAGFTPQEIELDASAILQGEPATVPVVMNDRAYTMRVRFPEQTRASLDSHPQHAAHQRHRDTSRRWARWRPCRRIPGRPKFAAKTCSGTSR